MTFKRMGQLMEYALQWSLPVCLAGMWYVS